MKVLLDIRNNKEDFVLELLDSFKFVKTKPLTSHKAEVLQDIQEAVTEMQLIKSGIKQARDAEVFLNEL